VATRTDGTGVTTYAYHPVGGLGAGQLATVDGPLIDDTITYTCDQLGRVIVRAINSVGVTLAFDALGRVTSEVNVLGTFGYTYDGVSGRVATPISRQGSQRSCHKLLKRGGVAYCW
jgi:YD repeat-containing protein